MKDGGGGASASAPRSSKGLVVASRGTRRRARTRHQTGGAHGGAGRHGRPGEGAYTVGFPRAGDLDGSTDMYITRHPDPDERERAILWSDPERDARTRERLSRSPTRRAEAESMVVHSEPTKPDVYVGKRWVSHRDLPEKRRERCSQPAVARDRQKCEPRRRTGSPRSRRRLFLVGGRRRG